MGFKTDAGMRGVEFARVDAENAGSFTNLNVREETVVISCFSTDTAVATPSGVINDESDNRVIGIGDGHVSLVPNVAQDWTADVLVVSDWKGAFS